MCWCRNGKKGNVKVYTCRERGREGARGGVSDASGVGESESKRKERREGFLMDPFRTGAVGTGLRHVLLGW